MIDLCTVADVTARPELVGRQVSDDDTAKIAGWITDASGLIEGYLQREFIDTDPIPKQATVVCARMVARALTTRQAPPTIDSVNSSMGPFAASQHITQDALGGGVWLTRQDRLLLDGIMKEPRMTNVAMYDAPTQRPIGSANSRLFRRGGY